MNDIVLNALKERRSIRAYKKEQIKPEELEAVIEAGRYAATAAGRQGTLFVAVTNSDMVKRLSKMNADIMGSNADPYYGAPAVVLVFADNSHNTHVEDGSCAMQNMMNAAYAAGLGSCWIHRERQMFETEEGKKLKKEWGISDNYVGIGACILGYSAVELPKAKERRNDQVIYVK